MSLLSRWLGGGASDARTDADARETDASGTAGRDQAGDRRHRDTETAEGQLRGVLAQKVLHGWLQNRHQTQMPLSVNLGRLGEADQVALARFGALACMADNDPRSPERVRAWLAGTGAGDPALAAFSEACAGDVPPLPTCLAAVAGPVLAPLAFVAALVAARDGGPASRLFADYVAARLALPSAAIRSAERRYRV